MPYPINKVSPKQALPLNIVDETFSQSQIYCNQLLRLRQGFPLYIPGPSEMLPAEHSTSGIQIGDVGTVTPEGLFDCSSTYTFLQTIQST
ncbi:hypothetical protein B0H14DRAFT_2378431 [Mycena olivaceomarginata]|nr:hypothetical protein B0H14DRAFT_2378431 [Mycena olivaceomarginata]